MSTKTSFPKGSIKVLLLENIAQSAVDLLVKEGYQVETISKLSPADLKEKIKDVHAIGIRSKTKLTAEVLKEAKKLLAIGHFCIGTDQTDMSFAATMGVPVFNSPFANTRSVAEMMISNIIAVARQIGDRNRELHQGTWRKVSKHCHEVRGKTLGIIGYGHVGSQLSVLAESMGINVQYYDIMPKLPLGMATCCPSLEHLLKTSDFVSLHVPLTEDTKNMFGKKEVEMMRKGSYLFNLARGPCVDIDAISEALKSGHLAGAAFDVYPQEPAGFTESYTNALMGCPNTILTPHIGGSTEEAQANIGLEVGHKLIQFINTGATVGSVNIPEVSLKVVPGRHRILNVHENVHGVLKAINNCLGDYNIMSQALVTMNKIGYLMVELEHELGSTQSAELKEMIASLPTSIRTRIVFH